MRRLRLSLAAVVVLAIAALPAVLCSAQEQNADRDALRAAQQKLHSAAPAQRLAAIHALQGLPALEGAKMLAPAMLVDGKTAVQRAAYETLLTWKERRDVCIYLTRVLDKELRSRKMRPALAGGLVAVLLASDTPETQHDFRELLDGSMTTARRATLVLLNVADAWGNQGDLEALGALRRMSKLKYFADVFACRRAVVQAMTMIRLPEAIDALVELLPGVDGEVRGDIVRYLTAVTRQQHAFDVAAWQIWWKDHRDGFEFPAKVAASRDVAIGTPGLPSYYGLTIQAKRLVFVVDISGSMEGLRINTLKRELTQAINGLPADAMFNIVAFSTRVGVWQRNLIPATPANRQRASQFVIGLRTGGETASYDALQAAFGFDIEAVYFLSDGDPNFGTITIPDQIVAAVTKGNRARRISVYTIGIAPGLPGSPLDNFMRALADSNLGIYRRIDR